MGWAWVLESSVSSLNISNCSKLSWLYLAGIWVTLHEFCKWLSHLACYPILWNLYYMLASVLLFQVQATSKWPSTLSINIHNAVFKRKMVFIPFSKLGAAHLVSWWGTGWTPGIQFPTGTTHLLYSIVSRPPLVPTQPPTQHTMGNGGSTRYVLMTVHN
jgi:hypothetical protein